MEENTLQDHILTAFEAVDVVNQKTDFALKTVGYSEEKTNKMKELNSKIRGIIGTNGWVPQVGVVVPEGNDVSDTGIITTNG